MTERLIHSSSPSSNWRHIGHSHSALLHEVLVHAFEVQDVLDRVTIAETQCLAREHRVHADATLCHRSKNVERKGFKTLGYDRLDLHSIRIVAHVMTTVLANSGLVWVHFGLVG